MLSDSSKLMVLKLKEDFKLFSEKCLKVKNKQAKIVDFVMNDAQISVHARLEEQKRETGKVRALLLKGRQQGMSTYVQARFYWIIRFNKGLKAFILTHLAEATDNLFAMTSRYHDNMPDGLKPSTGTANAKELYFDLIDGGYKVSTAGSKGTGRSDTAQLFHGSEVAYWDSAEMHMAGIGQIIPDSAGTEMILESTGNGPANLFYEMWQDAEKGLSDYIPIFTPWFVTQEYRREVPPKFEVTAIEADLVRVYGIDHEQLAWRRAKIANDFRGDVSIFKQEYPNNPIEAFMVASEDSYIQLDDVIAAYGREGVEAYGADVWGLDPAEFGDDESVLVKRTGRKHYYTRAWSKKAPMELVGLIVNEYENAEDKPDAIFVDAVGIGSGICDRLKELLGNNIVIRVHSGEKALESETYLNKRAEMWGVMREWLMEIPCSILADSVLQAQLVAVRYGYDSARRVKLERKEDMKKRGIKSPDRADALALTFSQSVLPKRKKKEGSRTYNWRVGA